MNAVELMMEHYHQQLQQQHQQQHSSRQSSQTPKLTKFYSSDDSLDDGDFGPLEDEESGGNSTEVFQHFFGPNANNSNDDDGGGGQQFGMQMNNKNQQTKQQNDNNKKQFTSTTTAGVPEHSKSVAATTLPPTIVSMKSLQNEWKERQISRAKLNNSTNKLDEKMEKLNINGSENHKTWNGNLTENDFEKFRQIWGCNSSNVAEIALLPPTAESSTITATTSNSIPSSSISPPNEEVMSMSLATNTHTTTDTAGVGQQSIILHEQELEKLRMELELERLRGQNWKLNETNGYLLHNYALLFLMLRDADSLANGLFYKLNALKWQQQFNPMPLPPPLYFTGSPMPMLPLPPPPPPPPNAISPYQIPYLPSPPHPHRPQPAILPPCPPPMMPLPMPMYAHPHPAFFRPPLPLPLPMQISGSFMLGGQHQHFYPGPGHAGAPQFSSSSSNESIMGGNVNVSGGSPLEIRSIHQISADPTLRTSTPMEEEYPHLMATKQNCATCSPPPLPPHLVERERRILPIRPPPMDGGQNTNGNWPMHSNHQIMPRKPTNFWNPADCGLEMAITGEGQRACKQGVSYVYDFSSVRARFPIKLCGSGFYYFEVKIVVRNNRIWIGLSNRQFPLQTSLGYRLGWGYANFGCFFDCGRAKAYGEDYGTDDVIGCGLDLANGELFFTKNGTHLGIATKLSLPTTADPNELLFPTVSMCADGSTVLANFGQANFAWDINKAIMNNNNIGPK